MTGYRVKVEDGGVVLRGLGVPFGEWTIVADKDGQLFSEIWDGVHPQTAGWHSTVA